VSCKRSVAENLAACSERDHETGCLIWIGSLNENGYGRYGSREVAHRVAYTEAKGPIAPGLLVCHTCDTPACIEPDHLFLGTNSDNTADCLSKGRHAFGKLSHDDVRAIRTDPRPKTVIASAYGVSPTSIRRLRSGKSWRFVA
jgi:hypothetical protein